MGSILSMANDPAAIQATELPPPRPDRRS